MNAAAHATRLTGDWLLIILVIVAALPELAASWQFLLITRHWKRNHYRPASRTFRGRRC